MQSADVDSGGMHDTDLARVPPRGTAAPSRTCGTSLCRSCMPPLGATPPYLPLVSTTPCMPCTLASIPSDTTIREGRARHCASLQHSLTHSTKPPTHSLMPTLKMRLLPLCLCILLRAVAGEGQGGRGRLDSPLRALEPTR